MTEFNLNNISEVYVGNIYMITRISPELINTVKKSNLKDVSSLCFSIIAKKDATLIKIEDNYYIDIDAITCSNDIKIINSLIKKKDYNNNIILKEGTNDPYVGELFVGNIKKYYKSINNKKCENKLLSKRLIIND